MNLYMNNWKPLFDGSDLCKAQSFYHLIGQTINRQIKVDSKIDLLRGRIAHLLFLGHFSDTPNCLQNGLDSIFSDIQKSNRIDGALMTGSANYKGRGFFPDLASAARWNKVNYIWTDGYLYENSRKMTFVQKRTVSEYDQA